MPFLAVAAGIASFSLMDGLMKGASLAVGAYSAMLWRSLTSAANRQTIGAWTRME